jgi:hypothetical protein
MIDAETARTHPQRNCLTSALTGKDIPELDCPGRGWNWRMATSSFWPATGLQSVAEEDLASILDETSSHLKAATSRRR